jgi:hypothetical protein
MFAGRTLFFARGCTTCGVILCHSLLSWVSEEGIVASVASVDKDGNRKYLV